MEPTIGSAESLAPILRVLAESLNPREVFAKISEEAQRIVPHDFLLLGILTDDGRRAKVYALTGEMPGATKEIELPEPIREAAEQGVAITFHDVHADETGNSVIATIKPDGRDPGREVRYENQPFFRGMLALGLHSFLRVEVGLRGGRLGGLTFGSKEPSRYGPDHIGPARYIADCVALALAHQRLAEAEQKSAEARAHAAKLEVQVRRLTAELDEKERKRVIGRDNKWLDVLSQAAKVAPTEATVLISGESGSGKEVVARTIYRASPRANGPFIALNCAALPEQLLESELFGHERGAFTGALNARVGRIEQAAGGVLFLDEVGEMSPAVQAKLLRVLQEREYDRVGGSRTLKADIRVIAATNRDLKAAIGKGTFREDLYYRLAVFDIALPPLRERPGDIPLIVDAVLEEIGQSVGRPATGLSLDARERLLAYTWPGNVRELRNVIERAVILCEGGLITSEHLPLGIAAATKVEAAGVALSPTAGDGAAASGGLLASEREMIVQALARAGQNKSKAARLLGLTRAQLRSRIEKHNIPPGA